jgi:uncharacterized protein YukE
VAFNEAEYQALIERLNALGRRLAKLIDAVGPTLQPILSNPLVPDDMKSAVAFAGRTITKHAQSALDTLHARSAHAEMIVPPFLRDTAKEWRQILREASSIAEGIRTKDAVSAHWSGEAFTKYVSKKNPQSAAAKRVQAIAEKMATALDSVAEAELARFQKEIQLWIGLVVALLAALAAAGTGVGAPGGVAIAVLSIVGFGAEIFFNDSDFQEKCKTLAATLTNEKNDKSDFGDGLWPKAVAADFRKATPEDDKVPVSDWDVKP